MNVLSHEHDDNKIIDADVEHFIIDTTTRAITSETKKLSLMQYDHKSERYSFDVNRMIDGHDLMDCNRVQIHFINIGSNKQKHPGLYLVTDVHENPLDNNKLTFSWLITNDATTFDGTLSFLVSFECVEDDKILYRWSSSAYKSIVITVGMDNNNTIHELYADELLAWENYMENELSTWQNEMETNYLPNLVDECYVEREFATSDEVAMVFDITNPDGEVLVTVVPYEEVTAYIDEALDREINGALEDSY